MNRGQTLIASSESRTGTIAAARRECNIGVIIPSDTNLSSSELSLFLREYGTVLALQNVRGAVGSISELNSFPCKQSKPGLNSSRYYNSQLEILDILLDI